MFLDKDANRKMLDGSYKKFKSYYHYNKNFIFMKQKVAEFEFDEDSMNHNMNNLAEILEDLTKRSNKKQINEWIEKIDYYVMPKSFVEKNEKSKMFVTGDAQENKPVNKVNFFIDMPIELHLLETLWTVFVGKLAFEKGIISEDCYGNCIDNSVVYNHEDEFVKSINFNKNKLFKIYFYQYCLWKNKAIETIEKEYMTKRDTALFSLDIKSYYYSVKFKFDMMHQILCKDERYEVLGELTSVIERIFLRYTQLLADCRKVDQNVKKKEVLLPIGLFSSMLIANLYLSKFDHAMKENSHVLYYGRYVDDILILLDVSKRTSQINSETIIDKYLVSENKVLDKLEQNKYSLSNYPNLVIQKDKVKVIYFEAGKSRSIINQLRKTIKYPSQMNILPDTDMQLNDFEEAAYVIRNFDNETKIRDIGHVEVDSFQLGWHLSQMVQKSKVDKKLLTKEEKANRQHEGVKILEFFQLSKALEYSSNWINVMYYFMLIDDTRSLKKFESNTRQSIKVMKTEQIEGILKGKNRTIKARMKKCLEQHFNICAATALAINPTFSKKEIEEILKLALKLRKANLFNHYLVSYPLINYVDELDDYINLTKMSLEVVHKLNLNIKENRKVKLSPRFVNIDELFQLVFLRQIISGGNYYLDGKSTANEKIRNIENFFYELNNINIPTAKSLAINFSNEIVLNKYIVQRIKLGLDKKPKARIKIAIANIKLDTKMCCYGLESQIDTPLKKKDFIMFLSVAYGTGKDKVDFLLFPEFYLPIDWIAEVLAFVRKTGITVIAGLQYMKYNNQAFNNVAVIAPVETGKYRNAFLMVREKNDYAPMEQEVLAIKKYICKNQEIPCYQVFSNAGIDYGTFLCYEFTDIIARSLYKNQIDLLFTPEHNRDTTYFSNIIETTTRDLHAFIVQSNTSIYGDSRITGPYGRNDRNIVQIKGGDMDNIIIGTIDLEAIMEYQDHEKVNSKKKIEEYLGLNNKDRYEVEQKLYEENKIKIAKTSARFDGERVKYKK